MLQSDIESLLDERAKLHPNDPKIENYWDKISSLLGKDLSSTITVFYSLSENHILLLSEVFDDIAIALQSYDFICALRELENKFPNIDISSSISIAESCIPPDQG